MEEPKKSIKLKVIKPDSTVNVSVGAGYYNRVQTLLFDHINTVEPEIAIKALTEIKTREPKDKWEYNLLTILTLVYAAEEAFQTGGFTQDTEVPLPEEKV